jgi:hypothetical protein
MSRFWILAITAMLFCACAKNDRRINTTKAFDLPGYLDSEILALGARPRIVEKTLREDEALRESVDTVLDWEKELEIFRGYDLNSARSGEFRLNTDSSMDLSIETWYNTDSTAELQELMITRRRGHIELLQLRTRNTGRIRDRHSVLSYQPRKGYGLRMSEKYIWGEPHVTEIFAQIIDPETLHR